MLPPKELNIYLKNVENIKALLSYYFDKYNLKDGSDIEELYTIKNLQLNQLEFIAKKVSESYETVFEKDLGSSGLTISNLMRFGIDGLTKEEKDWSLGPYSKGRQTIKRFIDFVNETNKD